MSAHFMRSVGRIWWREIRRSAASASAVVVPVTGDRAFHDIGWPLWVAADWPAQPLIGDCDRGRPPARPLSPSVHRWAADVGQVTTVPPPLPGRSGPGFGAIMRRRRRTSGRLEKNENRTTAVCCFFRVSFLVSIPFLYNGEKTSRRAKQWASVVETLGCSRTDSRADEGEKNPGRKLFFHCCCSSRTQTHADTAERAKE